ncbi:hypothetical protein CLOM_g18985 [Closterium sp. NIES-68]|nr:hypothetical protein CLOM_g18985 [Closterium sp. NIES-68]GJP66177.1 hypothetical protein CLOP_g23082 [Closterium sp. NIES-67]
MIGRTSPALYSPIKKFQSLTKDSTTGAVAFTRHALDLARHLAALGVPYPIPVLCCHLLEGLNPAFDTHKIAYMQLIESALSRLRPPSGSSPLRPTSCAIPPPPPWLLTSATAGEGVGVGVALVVVVVVVLVAQDVVQQPPFLLVSVSLSMAPHAAIPAPPLAGPPSLLAPLLRRFVLPSLPTRLLPLSPPGHLSAAAVAADSVADSAAAVSAVAAAAVVPTAAAAAEAAVPPHPVAAAVAPAAPAAA